MARVFTEHALRLGTVFRIQIAEPLYLSAARIEWNKTTKLGEIVIYTEPLSRISRPTEKTDPDTEWRTTKSETQGSPIRMG